MTAVEVNPLYLNNCLMTIGDNEFQKHLSAVTMTPSTASASWTGMGGNTHTAGATTSWVCDLTYIQDWKSKESLSRYLFDNAGKTVPVLFQPVDGGTSWTGVVTITPGAIGGKVNTWGEVSVSLGMNDSPQPVDEPAPVEEPTGGEA